MKATQHAMFKRHANNNYCIIYNRAGLARREPRKKKVERQRSFAKQLDRACSVVVVGECILKVASSCC